MKHPHFRIPIENLQYTVKSFNFVGTEFHGLMTLDMFMDN